MKRIPLLVVLITSLSGCAGFTAGDFQTLTKTASDIVTIYGQLNGPDRQTTPSYPTPPQALPRAGYPVTVPSSSMPGYYPGY